MLIANVNWNNSNENRTYPICETSTLISSSGDRLPDNILTDCRLIIPVNTFWNGTTQRAFITSITSSPQIISVTFCSTNQNENGSILQAAEVNETIAAVSIVKPVVVGKLYPVYALLEGVVGWVAFGQGAVGDTEFDYRFNSPSQTLLVNEAAYFYQVSAINSLNKKDFNLSLKGTVNLKTSSGIKITQTTKNFEDGSKEVLLFSLDRERITKEINQQFLGPCRGNPTARSCKVGPIYRLNDVTPDCDGNITIEFVNPEVDLQVFQGGGGISVQVPVGTDGVCFDQVNHEGDKLPKFHGRSGIDVPQFVPVDPSTVLWSRPDTFTFLETFDTFSAPEFNTLHGMSIQYCELKAQLSDSSVAQTNYAYLNPSFLSDPLGHSIGVVMRLTAPDDPVGIKKANGYVRIGDFYIGLEINSTGQTLFVIKRMVSSELVTLSQRTVSLVYDANYLVTVSTGLFNLGQYPILSITASVDGINGDGDSYFATQSISVSGVSSLSTAGLYTDNAITFFDNFIIDWDDELPLAYPCDVFPDDYYGYYDYYRGHHYGYDSYLGYYSSGYLFNTYGQCFDCESLRATMLNSTLLGVSCIPVVDTDLRSGDSYAGRVQDGISYTELYIEFDWYTCAAKISMIFSDGYSEIYAYGETIMPPPGLSQTVQMHAFSPAHAEFWIQLECTS
jgi:hypothetical protein